MRLCHAWFALYPRIRHTYFLISPIIGRPFEHILEKMLRNKLGQFILKYDWFFFLHLEGRQHFAFHIFCVFTRNLNWSPFQHKLRIPAVACSTASKILWARLYILESLLLNICNSMSSSSRLNIITYNDKAMKADLLKQLAVYTNAFQEGMQNVTRPKWKKIK